MNTEKKNTNIYFELSTELGICSAIAYSVLRNSMDLNKKYNNREFFKRGSWWTRQTIKDVKKSMPNYCIKSITMHVNKLVELGYLIKDYLGHCAYDHTSWYTIGPKGIIMENPELSNSANAPTEFGREELEYKAKLLQNSYKQQEHQKASAAKRAQRRIKNAQERAKRANEPKRPVGRPRIHPKYTGPKRPRGRPKGSGKNQKNNAIVKSSPTITVVKEEKPKNKMEQKMDIATQLTQPRSTAVPVRRLINNGKLSFNSFAIPMEVVLLKEEDLQDKNNTDVPAMTKGDTVVSGSIDISYNRIVDVGLVPYNTKYITNEPNILEAYTLRQIIQGYDVPTIHERDLETALLLVEDRYYMNFRKEIHNFPINKQSITKYNYYFTVVPGDLNNPVKSFFNVEHIKDLNKQISIPLEQQVHIVLNYPKFFKIREALVLMFAMAYSPYLTFKIREKIWDKRRQLITEFRNDVERELRSNKDKVNGFINFHKACTYLDDHNRIKEFLFELNRKNQIDMDNKRNFIVKFTEDFKNTESYTIAANTVKCMRKHVENLRTTSEVVYTAMDFILSRGYRKFDISKLNIFEWMKEMYKDQPNTQNYSAFSHALDKFSKELNSAWCTSGILSEYTIPSFSSPTFTKNENADKNVRKLIGVIRDIFGASRDLRKVCNRSRHLITKANKGRRCGIRTYDKPFYESTFEKSIKYIGRFWKPKFPKEFGLDFERCTNTSFFDPNSILNKIYKPC